MASRIRAQAVSNLDGLMGVWSMMDLKAQFADEISRLSAVQNDVNEKLGWIETAEAAGKAKADADLYASNVKASADVTKVNADALAANAKAAMDAAVTHENAVKLREQTAAKTIEEYTAKISDATARNASKEQALATREAGLIARETALASASADLTQRQKAFQAKLDSLKETTA